MVKSNNQVEQMAGISVVLLCTHSIETSSILALAHVHLVAAVVLVISVHAIKEQGLP